MLKHRCRGAIPVAAFGWIALFANSLPAGMISSSNCLPPLDPGAAYAGQAASWASFSLNNPMVWQFSNCLAPPENVGDTTLHIFTAVFEGDFVSPTGAPVHVAGNADVQILLQKVQKVQTALALGDISEYDAEILLLQITAGDLTPAVRIRESPTLPSLGHTRVTDLGGGAFGIQSFFDVFTELSLDGGQTWIPSQGSTRTDLQSVPEPATLVSLGIGLAAVAIGRLRRRRRPAII